MKIDEHVNNLVQTVRRQTLIELRDNLWKQVEQMEKVLRTADNFLFCIYGPRNEKFHNLYNNIVRKQRTILQVLDTIYKML